MEVASAKYAEFIPFGKIEIKITLYHSMRKITRLYSVKTEIYKLSDESFGFRGVFT